MRVGFFPLLVVAPLLATTFARDTGSLFRGRGLQRRTGEDDKDKNSSSVAAGFPFPSKPFFSKDETSSIPTSSVNAEAAFFDYLATKDKDKSSVSPTVTLNDDKPTSVPDKDKSSSVNNEQAFFNYLATKDKDKSSVPSTVTPKDDKPTSAPDKEKSTSVNNEQVFFNYLATKDKDKKLTSIVVQNVSSTSIETGSEKFTGLPSKDKSSGPAVIVYSITIPATPTSTAKPSGGLLYAPSNVLLSGVTFPGYEIVPSPSGGLLKDTKSEKSILTSVIPVWTPALLGHAYGGGVIPTPSIYVVRQSLPNGPPTGVPPGYGGSSPQTIGPISNLSSVENKISIPSASASLLSSVGTGSVKLEASSPFVVYYITETILTTTTYCPVTTISGKPYTLSSTTVTKTFYTAIVVAVTQGTPVEAATKHILLQSAVSGNVPGSKFPIATSHIAASNAKASSETAIGSGKLPPSPSKEAGISQGRFTNTSIEVSLTTYQSISGHGSPSKIEPTTITIGVPSNTPASSASALASEGLGSTPHKVESEKTIGQSSPSKIPGELGSLSVTINGEKPSKSESQPAETSNVVVVGLPAAETISNHASTPTLSAISSSLISELSSLFASSGTHAPTVSAVPVSLASELLSVFGSTSASTTPAANLQIVSVPTSTSTIGGAPGSKPEVKPTIPASLVSALSSLLNSPGVESQSTAVVPASLISKVASALLSPGGSTLIPATNFATPAIENGLGITGSVSIAETTIQGEVSGASSVPKEEITPASGPGAGSSIEGSLGAAATPVPPGISLPAESSIVNFATPPAGLETPVESSGPTSASQLQGSIPAQPETKAGSPVVSGNTPLLQSAPATPVLSSLEVASPQSGSLTEQGSPGSPKTTPAFENSPATSPAKAVGPTGPLESASANSENVKPENTKGGPGFVGSPDLTIVASQSFQGISNATATPINTANGSGLGSTPETAAGASISKGEILSLATATVLSTPGAVSAPAGIPTPPHEAIGSNIQTLGSPGSITEQSSEINKGASVSSPTGGALPGSSPEHSSAETEVGVTSGPSAGAVSTPSPEQSSLSSQAASGPSLPAGVLPGSSPDKSYGTPPASETAIGSSVLASILVGSPPAETSPTSEAAGFPTPPFASSEVVALTTSTATPKRAGISSPVLPTSIVIPQGGSPGGPIIATGTQASASTGTRGNSNSKGNSTVSVLLNPTAVSPFLGAGGKMPTPFGFGISALLGLFLL